MLIDSRCISSLSSKENVKNSLCFCKDKHDKKRQLRFDVAKAAVFRQKRAVFTTQNNHFCDAKYPFLQCSDNKWIKLKINF